MNDQTYAPFADDVARAFAFLQGSYGFAVARSTPSCVRYESPTVYVVIFHDQPTGEVGVYIGLRALDPEYRGGYPIQEIAQAKGMVGRAPDCFARTEAVLRTCAIRLAELVEKHGTQALRGNRAFFLQLSDMSIAETKKSTIPSQSETWARADIRTAWEAQDYVRVAFLYAWLDEQQLSPAEQQQREFARNAFLAGGAS